MDTFQCRNRVPNTSCLSEENRPLVHRNDGRLTIRRATCLSIAALPVAAATLGLKLHCPQVTTADVCKP